MTPIRSPSFSMTVEGFTSRASAGSRTRSALAISMGKRTAPAKVSITGTPSSNSWLPTAIASKPIAFMNSAASSLR